MNLNYECENGSTADGVSVYKMFDRTNGFINCFQDRPGRVAILAGDHGVRVKPTRRNDQGAPRARRTGPSLLRFTPALPSFRPGRGLHQDITLASRYECKYIIDPSLVGALRQYIQPFMKPDHYAAKHEGYCYPICSLYLDSLGLNLYQQTIDGTHNRFKLRVRTYSDEENGPVFYEVKQKLNNIVRKRRARLTRAQSRLLQESSCPSISLAAIPLDQQADVEYFQHSVRLSDARPVVKIKYMREAYEAKGGDPVRITLDTDLTHTSTLGHELSHAKGRWIHTPLSGVILEFKFTNRFPMWLQEMVRFFNIKQQSVPKYIMAVDNMLQGGSESVLSLGGFTLPPRRI
jgi:hypothetical protein